MNNYKILSQIAENHNCYIFWGDGFNLIPQIRAELRQKGFAPVQIIEFNCKNFLIDDAKHIINIFSRSSTDKEFYLISLESITEEAQNALLKILESLSLNKYFFIIADPRINLLPTLKSRFIIKDFSTRLNLDKSELLKFLESDFETRLNFLNKICLKEGKINKFILSNFLDNLLGIVEKRPENLEILKEIINKKNSIFFVNSNLKNLLEFFCLTLPKNKN